MSGINSGGGWAKIAGGGAGGGTSRGYGLPNLASPRFTHSSVFFEDFHGALVLPGGLQTGLTATPDTLVNLAPMSVVPWAFKELAGTTGNIQNPILTGSPGTGILQVSTGGSANDAIVIDSGVSTQDGSSFSAGGLAFNTTYSAVWACRFMITSAAKGSHIWGFGINETPQFDWFTDPDTTYATTNGFCIYRNPSAYGSGAGTTAAGDITLRTYAGAGVTSATVLKANANWSLNTWYKVELYWNKTTPSLAIYLDGTLVTTLTTGLWTSALGCFSIGNKTTAAVSKTIAVDYFYYETELSAAR
jgi:hypothetical protein